MSYGHTWPLMRLLVMATPVHRPYTIRTEIEQEPCEQARIPAGFQSTVDELDRQGEFRRAQGEFVPRYQVSTPSASPSSSSSSFVLDASIPRIDDAGRTTKQSHLGMNLPLPRDNTKDFRLLHWDRRHPAGSTESPVNLIFLLLHSSSILLILSILSISPNSPDPSNPSPVPTPPYYELCTFCQLNHPCFAPKHITPTNRQTLNPTHLNAPPQASPRLTLAAVYAEGYSAQPWQSSIRTPINPPKPHTTPPANSAHSPKSSPK